MSHDIHFVVKDGDGAKVQCACGDWSHAVSWTMVPSAVTCPKCLQRIAEAPEGVATTSVSLDLGVRPR
jgi:hypothetical protein